MLTTLKNAFKVKEIRQRVLYTLGMLVVIRLASQLPVPGVNRDYFANWFAQQTGDAFNLLDAFTGGSFLSMSIIALNITPYITSSIIIQLLTIAIPKLEEMQKDGEEGRKKITAITRYVTVALAVIESGAMAIGFGRRGLLQTYNALNVITVIVALTAGSAFLMWIGERITEKGIGNGISVVLTINIVSRLPQDITALFNQFVAGKEIAPAVVASVIIIAVIIVMVVLVIILNSGIRKIPVQYAKKMQGRKMYGGNSSNIPLKINTAGVIPVIFASSLMQFPVIICSLLGVNGGTGFGGKVLRMLSSSNWCRPSEPLYSIGLVLYIVLVIFFAYFYSTIQYNPIEMANNLRKNNGAIPGIRPGKPTSDYIFRVLSRLTLIGALMLSVIALFPIIYSLICDLAIQPLTEGGSDGGMTISLGGTSLIIMCGVALETVRQLESQMMMRHYKGFLD